VRSFGYGPQDSQPLRRDMQAVPTEKRLFLVKGSLPGHASRTPPVPYKPRSR